MFLLMCFHEQRLKYSCESIKMVLMNPFAVRNGDADVEKGLMDTAG